MLVGTPWLAPEGLGSLCKDITYHFLSRFSQSTSVTFVSFLKKESNWEAKFHRIPSECFEQALLDGSLVKQHMASLPPWLIQYEGQSLGHISMSADPMGKSYEARAAERYAHIEPFAEDIDSLLQLDDPAKAIRQRLRDQGSKQNPARVILWLCSYLCFGRRLESLLPAFRNSGRWSRDDKAASMKKPGRPSRKGKQHGHSAVPLKKVIAESYRKFAEHGVPMTKIWRQALDLIFGCKTRKGTDGLREYYHPQGLPFPSYRSYRYHVLKAFGLSQVRATKHGTNAVRSESISEGAFTEYTANLYERSETDAYTCPDIPRHALTGKPAPSLVVARLICPVTGFLTGIGFSSGGESSSAYRSMYFCAAIPKSYFFNIFGLTFSDEQWPALGLPMDVIGDRGPHAGDTRMFGSASTSPVIREITPSYDGQAKAIIESSHPREGHIDAPPSHLLSNLTTFQMARREVYQLLKDNETSDVSDRLTPEMVAQDVIGTPIGMFQFLQLRGRSNAIPMSIQDAIRSYLDPVTFTFDRNGLHLKRQPFRCEALQNYPNVVRSAAQKRIEIKGFVYPVALRMAWIEINGKIEEVHAILRINDDKAQLELTLSELIELEEAKKAAASSMLEHKAATASSLEEDYKRQTGLDWKNGQRRAGKAPSRKERKNSGTPDGAKAA